MYYKVYDTFEVCTCAGANRIQSMQTCHPADIGSNSLFTLLHFLFSWAYLILFSFHLSVSFIIYPFVFFFHCFPSALVCCCLLYSALFICLSDLSSGKSSLHLDSQSLMGAASGTNTSEGQEKCFILGKIFSKSQKRLQKRAKVESTKHYMYVGSRF